MGLDLRSESECGQLGARMVLKWRAASMESRGWCGKKFGGKCASPDDSGAPRARRVIHSAVHFIPAFNSRTATSNSGSLFIDSVTLRVACSTVV